MSIEAARVDALLFTKQSLLALDGGPDEIFRAAVDHCRATVPQADGAIVEMREGDELVCCAASGGARHLIGRRLSMRRSFAGRSIRAGQPMLCDDITLDATVDHHPYRDANMRALMVVPLVHGDFIGALKFYSTRPGMFDSRDLTIAQLVAGQIVSGLNAVAERAAVRARKESEARFEAITESLPQMIWAMTREGRSTYCNRRALQFLGWKNIDTLRCDAISFIEPDHRDAVWKTWTDALADGRARSFECRVRPARGPARWVLCHLVPVPGDDGSISEWIGAGIDIDERKSIELALQDALHARDLLLHEVNHRVKNSLQIVTGLLALQASKIREPEARARLLDARAQVATIAKIHQAIYKTSQHDEVEFVSFLKHLAQSLVGAGDAQRATLRIDGTDRLVLPLDKSVPIALVAGEVIANAVKHGASEGGKAEIHIRIEAEKGGMSLDIFDNGPGLPPDFDPERSEGLGMEIIFGLAEQAGGRAEIVPTGRGAHFVLRVPLE